MILRKLPDQSHLKSITPSTQLILHLCLGKKTPIFYHAMVLENLQVTTRLCVGGETMNSYWKNSKTLAPVCRDHNRSQLNEMESGVQILSGRDGTM